MHIRLPFTLCSLVLLTLTSPSYSNEPAATSFSKKADEDHLALTESSDHRNSRMKWWRDAKFGMFIHWGLYSGLAGEWKGESGKGAEWIQKNVEASSEEYATEALPLFTPKEGFADEWAALAEAAGCQYAVMTTKHHDGFALFDSKVSEFDAKDLKSGRDLVAEYVEAFRKKGLKVGFYYSVIDWHQKDYDNTINPDLCYPKGQEEWLKNHNIPRNHQAYQQYIKDQVHELMTNYGKVDVIWWDYSQDAMQGKKGWDAPNLISLVRKAQPDIIMNDRLYTNTLNQDKTQFDLRCGDYSSPEKNMSDDGYEGIDWELCQTIGQRWGFNREDTQLKSKDDLILMLAKSTTRGGNLLLNINPQADGTVPLAVTTTLRGVGSWLKINGEAVYGTRPYKLEGDNKELAATVKGKDIFIYVMQTATQERTEPLSIDLPKGYTKAKLLGSDEEITVDSANKKVTLSAEQIDGMTVPVIKISH
jgi:alpha-L-fucosidase